MTAPSAGRLERSAAGDDGTPVIRARGVGRRFGSLRAVDGVDLEVYRGEVFGFLGPNGAGKSTLLRLLIGLLSPSEGAVEVLGLELPRQSEELRRHVGYMPQRFSLYQELSVEENLWFAGEIFGVGSAQLPRKVDDALAEYGLGDRRRQLAATLSGGWKQRLSLAAAVIHEPRILVLDEPTAGVDPEERRVLWERLFDLAGRDTTVLVSTHYMDEAVRCHRLTMLIDGRRVALGSPRRLASALADRVVEVEAEPPERAVAVLRGEPAVASVTQLGDLVHGLLEAGGPTAAEAAPRLAARLREEGFDDVTARAAPPTLEDVFVAITLGERLDGAGDAGGTTAREAGR